MERCPLCGKNMTGGVCGGCGFELPDFDKIAAPYDLDPSNVLFGEPDEKSDFPVMEPIDGSAPNAETVPPPVQPAQTQQLSQASPIPPLTPFERVVRLTVDFAGTFWWQLLLMLIVPTLGIALMGYDFFMANRTGLKRYYIMAGAAFALCLVLRPEGYDPPGPDRYVQLLFDFLADD